MPSRRGDLVDLLSGQRKVSENQSPHPRAAGDRAPRGADPGTERPVRSVQAAAPPPGPAALPRSGAPPAPTGPRRCPQGYRSHGALTPSDTETGTGAALSPATCSSVPREQGQPLRRRASRAAPLNQTPELQARQARGRGTDAGGRAGTQALTRPGPAPPRSQAALLRGTGSAYGHHSKDQPTAGPPPPPPTLPATVIT